MTVLLILQTIGILLAGVAALIGVVNRQHIHSLHVDLNSRLTQLLASEHARGVGEGQQQERSRADTAASDARA